MNKKGLVDKIAADAEITKAAANLGLEAVLKSIHGALVNDGGVQLTGFVTFQTVKREARTGRNPRTGKALKIKAKTGGWYL
ncbi:MAG: HU family DNA-binding protein [SAR324 cluster bacterium]|nr:HU family DNA-binding protein [SAR324 cluster bacterium]